MPTPSVPDYMNRRAALKKRADWSPEQISPSAVPHEERWTTENGKYLKFAEQWWAPIQLPLSARVEETDADKDAPIPSPIDTRAGAVINPLFLTLIIPSTNTDPASAAATQLAELAAKMQVDALLEGTQMLEDGQLERARDYFFRKAKQIVGKEVRLPSIGGIQDGDGVRSDLYTKMMPYDVAPLMACCNGMAKYYCAKGDFESALAWLWEIELLFQNAYFGSKNPFYGE
ncbi:hypothetical protein NMY22_g2080 [Coprinellus aureogranulatus]|nr:hypothetical protein NMY22_g2080 [Coprinellus aureogranulatus]